MEWKDRGTRMIDGNGEWEGAMTEAVGKVECPDRAKKLTRRARRSVNPASELWFGKTENDIARKIERAHLYSFNLPNYRSSLSLPQIEAWKSFAATRVREGNGEATLEAKYRAVAAARTEELDEMLSSLDPRHTLELDWARQFLAGVPTEEFCRHPHLNTLQEVIASQAKAPWAKLKELLVLHDEPIRIDDDELYRLVTVRLFGNGVELRSVTSGARSRRTSGFERVQTS